VRERQRDRACPRIWDRSIRETGRDITLDERNRALDVRFACLMSTFARPLEIERPHSILHRHLGGLGCYDPVGGPTA